MWHSCGKFSLEDLFARSEPRVAKLFRVFAATARWLAEAYEIGEQKHLA